MRVFGTVTGDGPQGHRMMDALKQGLCVALASLALSLTGCAALLIGAGAAGGYAISKDSVTDHFDLPKESVFQRSVAAVESMGLVTLRDDTRGLIEAKVRDATVKISVRPVTRRTVQLSVKARSLLMPKIDVAQEVYKEIVNGLR